MADLFMVSDTLTHAKPIIHYIHTGVSYMTAVIASAISLAVGFGLGWYFTGGGKAKVDPIVSTVQADVAKL
jgi:hypothetical protein